MCMSVVIRDAMFYSAVSTHNRIFYVLKRRPGYCVKQSETIIEPIGRSWECRQKCMF